MKLTDEDIKVVAKKYNLEPACIKAVLFVESPGYGFYTSKGDHQGELLCRFEGHQFRKFTKGKYDKTHPKLSYSNWKLGNKYARKGQLEFGRFMEAFNLNKDAAWKATSWGLFQIMGYWGEPLYGSTLKMLVEFYKGEKEQLEGFIKYCQHTKILDLLRTKQWSKFALKYNGPGYKKNSYHTRLQQQYLNWKNKI